MTKSELKINEQSIKTELISYKNKPYKCLFEYIWNSFDAGANQVKLNFDLPENDFGYVKNIKITDNWKGWNFDDKAITDNFMSSTKVSNKFKTLPKGKYGRGRYSFIWIAEQIKILSKGKKLVLQHNTNIKKEKIKYNKSGTELEFLKITQDFSSILSSIENLYKKILLEFGWFLLENKNYKIFINNEEIDINKNIKKTKKISKKFFSSEIKEKLNDEFEVRMILWKEKPSEYSKYYFLNENNIEVFKQNTWLNKQKDNFWHSVYIKSTLFKEPSDIDKQTLGQPTLDFGDKKLKRIKRKIIQKIKEELILLRKPYLLIQSNDLLEDLKEEKLMPDLPKFGIYDEKSYEDLLKTIYTITPSLFVGKSKSERKFICATFAGLLSTQDNVLIKTILEQLQELTEAEKHNLLDILNRSSLSNIVKTIKEIDDRLEVLDKLKILISEHEKETLEVKYIQKILDKNFWIFGEQFRLFSTTEGALKKVLIKYAKEILEIDNPELETKPNGEVDLFLTKTEPVDRKTHKNIIVELKRASIKLGKKEYDQIELYMEKILKQNLCNGENQYWEFYLIGKNFNEHIERKIDSQKNHGEKERGLAFTFNDGKVKIYVRKWSDILEVEWWIKMKYLKEKLKIEAQKKNISSVDNIVSDLIK